MPENRSGRALATAAVLLLALTATFGLAGCGERDDSAVAGSSEASTPSADGAQSEAEESPQATPDGEPLPDDWPAEILVPDGTIVLVIPMGGGYALTVEGVDSEQAKGLIAQMAGAGLQTMGPTDMGNDEWTAQATSAAYTATYAYASGGAGLPNVAVNLTRVG